MSKIQHTGDNVNTKKSELNYYRIPKRIFETPYLSLSAKMIYQYLFTIASNNNGYCVVKLQTIADRICIDRAWASEKIEDLRNTGLIEVRKTGRASKYNIPAISGTLWQDAVTTLFGSESLTKSNSEFEKVKFRVRESQIQSLTKPNSNLKYISEISNPREKRPAQLTNMIPVTILNKYKSLSPITGNNEDAMQFFSMYLDLTDTDKQIILNATGIEKNILLDVWHEIKKSDYLQSMSLVWIIDNIEKVLNGKYRTYQNSK